jgi:hypothetical protein
MFVLTTIVPVEHMSLRRFNLIRNRIHVHPECALVSSRNLDGGEVVVVFLQISSVEIDWP